MKYEIDIKGLPKGWKPVAYRRPVFGEYYFYNDDVQQGRTGSGQFLIVEKIPHRRIVLEETEEESKTTQYINAGNTHLNIEGDKIWRVVEENND